MASSKVINTARRAFSATAAAPRHVLVPFFQVDSFSSTPLSGNPAAVVLLPHGLLDAGSSRGTGAGADDGDDDDDDDDDADAAAYDAAHAAHAARVDTVLKAVAAENNLSETAFLWPMSGAPSDAFGTAAAFRLRWFTPTKEVALCGHGTLAAAAALFHAPTTANPHDALTFHTASGALTATRQQQARQPAGAKAEAEAGAKAKAEGWEAAVRFVGASSEQDSIALDFPMNVPAVLHGDAAAAAAAGQSTAPTEGAAADWSASRAVADAVLRECGAPLGTKVLALARCGATKKLLVHVDFHANMEEGSGGGGGGGGQGEETGAKAGAGTGEGGGGVPGGDATDDGDGEKAATAAAAAASANASARAAANYAVLCGLRVPSPDRLLAAHDGSVVTGVSLVTTGGPPVPTTQSGAAAAYDFSSRYFAPWNGIPEDPVNGSSHTLLAPFWASTMMPRQGGSGPGLGPGGPGGVVRLRARQGSPRGGDLDLGACFATKRVTMAGPAAVVVQGTMAVPYVAV